MSTAQNWNAQANGNRCNFGYCLGCKSSLYDIYNLPCCVLHLTNASTPNVGVVRSMSFSTIDDWQAKHNVVETLSRRLVQS